MIAWLNSNAPAVTALATVALAGVTSVYVILTKRLTSGSDETNRRLQALAKALEDGQELQKEANLMKFYEIMGSHHITSKRGFDKAFPRHYEKWQQYQNPSDS